MNSRHRSNYGDNISQLSIGQLEREIEAAFEDAAGPSKKKNLFIPDKDVNKKKTFFRPSMVKTPTKALPTSTPMPKMLSNVEGKALQFDVSSILTDNAYLKEGPPLNEIVSISSCSVILADINSLKVDKNKSATSIKKIILDKTEKNVTKDKIQNNCLPVLAEDVLTETYIGRRTRSRTRNISLVNNNSNLSATSKRIETDEPDMHNKTKKTNSTLNNLREFSRNYNNKIQESDVFEKAEKPFIETQLDKPSRSRTKNNSLLESEPSLITVSSQKIEPESKNKSTLSVLGKKLDHISKITQNDKMKCSLFEEFEETIVVDKQLDSPLRSRTKNNSMNDCESLRAEPKPQKKLPNYVLKSNRRKSTKLSAVKKLARCALKQSTSTAISDKVETFCYNELDFLPHYCNTLNRFVFTDPEENCPWRFNITNQRSSLKLSSSIPLFNNTEEKPERKTKRIYNNRKPTQTTNKLLKTIVTSTIDSPESKNFSKENSYEEVTNFSFESLWNKTNSTKLPIQSKADQDLNVSFKNNVTIFAPPIDFQDEPESILKTEIPKPKSPVVKIVSNIQLQRKLFDDSLKQTDFVNSIKMSPQKLNRPAFHKKDISEHGVNNLSTNIFNEPNNNREVVVRKRSRKQRQQSSDDGDEFLQNILQGNLAINQPELMNESNTNKRQDTTKRCSKEQPLQSKNNTLINISSKSIIPNQSYVIDEAAPAEDALPDYNAIRLSATNESNIKIQSTTKRGRKKKDPQKIRNSSLNNEPPSNSFFTDEVLVQIDQKEDNFALTKDDEGLTSPTRVIEPKSDTKKKAKSLKNKNTNEIVTSPIKMNKTTNSYKTEIVAIPNTSRDNLDKFPKRSNGMLKSKDTSKTKISKPRGRKKKSDILILEPVTTFDDSIQNSTLRRSTRTRTKPQNNCIGVILVSSKNLLASINGDRKPSSKRNTTTRISKKSLARTSSLEVVMENTGVEASPLDIPEILEEIAETPEEIAEIPEKIAGIPKEIAEIPVERAETPETIPVINEPICLEDTDRFPPPRTSKRSRRNTGRIVKRDTFAVTSSSNFDETITIVRGTESQSIKWADSKARTSMFDSGLELDATTQPIVKMKLMNPLDRSDVGIMKLLPGMLKDRHSTKSYSLYFTVLSGHCEVGLEDKVMMFKNEGVFIIPLGSEYYIHNLSNAEHLMLSFVRIKS